MVVIDCESKKMALLSISNLFDIGNQEVEDFLIKRNWISVYEKNPFWYMKMQFSEFMFKMFQKKFGDFKNVDKVCWFHLARTMNPEGYNEGILPLNEIQPILLDQLYQLVEGEISKENWKKICKQGAGGHSGWLYNMKITDKVHYGPYAMLIRDIAFYSKEAGNHNYLRIPEIVEDIAVGLKENYGIDMFQRYWQNSQSVIVKFWKKPRSNKTIENYIGIVLIYLYHMLHYIPLSIGCNTCTDNQGIKVDKSDILEEEIIKEYKID